MIRWCMYVIKFEHIFLTEIYVISPVDYDDIDLTNKHEEIPAGLYYDEVQPPLYEPLRKQATSNTNMKN